ncbi:MAG: primosomal protein N' [Prevotella sp.]|nr:primosomal protein N' [Prevotella sp.]
MRYVDVILPLPLEGLFTYSLPDGLQVEAGARVLVPLAKTKKYVALAVRVHDQRPDFDVRPVEEVLDAKPIVTSRQIALWQWIADYYLSPLGEVYNAALPLGLKVRDGYRPKTETFVTLPEAMRSERMLHIALDMLSRSPKQLKVFTTFLDMVLTSRYEVRGTRYENSLVEGEDGNLAPRTSHLAPREDSNLAPRTSYLVPRDLSVSRDELMNTAHCTSAIVKQLIDKQFLTTYQKEVSRINTTLDTTLSPGNHHHPSPLSPAQQDAYNSIVLQWMSKPVVLLHGVTSSGKTEIYIHLIQQAIERGEQVLYLLPEIALTVQMRERLQRVFGSRLGIYHSKYSDAERVEIWHKQLSAKPYDIILGARSAVFLPFQRLGLVIVDEEHETSFKQQDPAPRYHARSVALVLARQFGAKTLLGTATPSAETYYNASPHLHPVLTPGESSSTPPSCEGRVQAGGGPKYGYVALTQRYQDIELPEIQIVDIKDLRRRKMMSGVFSPTLLVAMRQAFERHEQVILFQNRRGFAPMIECPTCGWVPHCTNCDVSLTYHKALNMLTCHYCGFTYRVPDRCPNCESEDLRGRGFGTEKIEDQLMELFPDIRVARMDLDSTRSRQAYERIINDFSNHRTDVLVGTQMVTKGLDFDNVSVVGILNADAMLNMPDFRAYELAFTMMAQVAGRAGRKHRRGLVLLQTKNPDHEIVRQLVANDVNGFYQNLMEERQAFRYPPFSRLVYVYLKHRDEQLLNTAAIEMASRLRQLFSTRVLGPDKPAVARVKTLFIRKIVLKLELSLNVVQVRQCLREVQRQLLADKRYNALQVYYDVDPL